MHNHSRRMPVWIGMLLMMAVFSGTLYPEKVEEVPNPRQARGAYVEDSGHVLGPEYIQLIDGICRRLKETTGAELAVVTVGDLGGTTIEDFAERLFHRFGIGEAGKDNGILILFARDDRIVRIEVGYGLEGVIPDARASQLLDTYAVPLLRNGQIGRGLFAVAKEVAQAVAAAANASLGISDPAAWPAQVAPPEPAAKPRQEKKGAWDAGSASLIFAAALIGFMLLGTLLVFLKVRGKRAKAAREKAIGGIKVFLVLMWIFAVIGFFLILGFGGKFLPPFISLIAAPTASTFFQRMTRKWMRRSVANYHLPCRACGQPMNLVSESEDDKLLSTEEVAEEKAGGMNYEFWKCAKCGEEERLEVKLGKAGPCPKCKRRTLTTSHITLVSATTSHGGRERITDTCQNPNCGFSKTVERDTPRISSSSSGSSSSGGSRSSSSGSFGGGRSGGGGASKRF